MFIFHDVFTREYLGYIFQKPSFYDNICIKSDNFSTLNIIFANLNVNIVLLYVKPKTISKCANGPGKYAN